MSFDLMMQEKNIELDTVNLFLDVAELNRWIEYFLEKLPNQS